MKKILFLFSFSILIFNAFSQNNNYWKKISQQPGSNLEQARVIIPQKYTVFSLSVNELKNAISSVHKGFYFEAEKKGVVVSIPMPDGSLQRFSIVQTDVMHPVLAAKFPSIKTYAGLGIDDKYATLRMDFTPRGFHGMILSPLGDVFIEPYSSNTSTYYISYYKKYSNDEEPLHCTVIDERSSEEIKKSGNASPLKSIAGTLSTYRLAVAATGEYTKYYGGTVTGAMAGITTSVNRITGVYETEVGVRLQLIPNNDLIVYTNGTTDPYDNRGNSTTLSQNQTNLDSVIGNSNYDIGHVFTTGGGGVANLGCVCRNASKAKGTSGKGKPEGDGFDIDYAAHEMGHQFNAEHTFNAATGSCGGGNRTAASAYEPGSGITVMGYAGICGINNLAPHSIAYFHNRSFTQITSYVTNGFGNNCPVVTTNTNQAPIINAISSAYNIPLNTPFTLTGSATDPDGDAITYSWEQFDNGPAGDWNAPTGDAPIFMSNEPSTSGTRLFPSLTNVLNNTNSKGDLKASYARTLHFRLTVRDNKGGVTNNDNLVPITVVNTTIPFEITTGNAAGTVSGGSTQTITWNVASTNVAPINCATVDITASTDGGNTFPYIIASNVSNNGSFSYKVPNVSMDSIRIKVSGRGNIFYDINNANLAIAPTTGIPLAAISKNMFNAVSNFTVYPNPAKDILTIQFPSSNHELLVTISDADGRIVYTTKLDAGKTLYQLSLPASIVSGTYFVKSGNDKPVMILVMK